LWLRAKAQQVFKIIELGAWYRIRWGGTSVFGQVLERHRSSYLFRYADEKGKVRTGNVSRSEITGRLGDHLIPDLESAGTPEKPTEPKAKIISPGNASKAGTATQDQIAPEATKKMPRPRKASTARRKGKPSKGQKSLFSE
jgi:hypothetical protein